MNIAYDRTTRIMAMHFRDKFNWFFMPWIILLSSFAVNLIIGSFLDEPLYSGGMASIFIYSFIIGILIIPQTFPLAIGLGTTRGDFFKGSALAGMAVAAGNTILLLLIIPIEVSSGGWGSNMYFYALPFLADAAMWQQFIIIFLAFQFCFYGGFVIGSFYRCFGGKGLLLSFLLGFIGSSVLFFCMQVFEWWAPAFNWLTRVSALELLLWTLPCTILFVICSFLMLKRSKV